MERNCKAAGASIGMSVGLTFSGNPQLLWCTNRLRNLQMKAEKRGKIGALSLLHMHMTMHKTLSDQTEGAER